MNKEQELARRNLSSKKYEVQGKLSESVDMLILFTREAEEDIDEMKLVTKEIYIELETFDKDVRIQESDL